MFHEQGILPDEKVFVIQDNALTGCRTFPTRRKYRHWSGRCAGTNATAYRKVGLSHDWRINCSKAGMIFQPGEGSEPEAPALTETLRSQWNMALHQSSVRFRRKAASNAKSGFSLTKCMDDLAHGSRDWLVLHDMKFKWRERSAQVDYLLINRQLEILLVYARLLDRRTRCLNGKWEELRRNEHWEPLPSSPLEQCRRKLFVLRKLVESERLAPHHHGVALPVNFKSLVLVDPGFETTGSGLGDILVWNLDTLSLHLRSAVPRAASFFVTVPPEILEAFGQRLLAWHHHELRVAL